MSLNLNESTLEKLYGHIIRTINELLRDRAISKEMTIKSLKRLIKKIQNIIKSLGE